MQKFSKYHIIPNIDAKTPDLASFELSPLEQGFGITIGNALRRVLLSSIPGASVFALKIPNVTNEHTTIKGVVEDLSIIILNIKQLAIEINEKIVDFNDLATKGLEVWPTLKINCSEPGPIFAKDIICPPGFKIHNPEMKICELAENRNLQIDMYVRIARGFVSAQENQELTNSLNIIAIDSYFSPILNVNYQVEEQKTSRQGVSDTLKMQVATDGSIKAADAFALAAQILVAHFSPIVSINETISQCELLRKEEDVQKMAFLATPIEELELTMRSYNSLKRNGILTVQELIDQPKHEIERIKNLGKKSLKEIVRKLQERGLVFKDQ